MDSTTPSTLSSSTTAAVDPAALRSCPKYRRRMSGLCRGIVCSLDTRCPECKPWSQEKMSAYLKRKVLLAGKRKKRQGPSTSSSPAVASSPSVDSHVTLPSVSEDSVIHDTVLSYLSSLSKSGSLGTNLSSFAAPSPVPDSAPSIKGVTGGVSGPEPHNLGGPTRSSGVGAGVISSSTSSIPTVLPNISVPLNVQPRVMQDVNQAVAQPLAYASVPLASSGLDQSRFAGGGGGGGGILYMLPSLPVFLLLLFCFLFLIFPLCFLPLFLLFLLHPLLLLSPSSAAPPSLTPPPTAPLSSFSGSFPSQLPPSTPSLVSSSLPPRFFPGSLSSTVPFPGYPSVPSSSSAPTPSLSSSYLSSLTPSSSSSPSLAPSRPPPGFPPGFPPLPLTSASSSSLAFASSSSSFPSGVPVPPSAVASSSSFPVASSSSPSHSVFSARLAELHAHNLDLSMQYVDLAKWFVSCYIGVSFLDFVSSSFPHLVPDLACDFSSGSSRLLSALRTPSLPVSLPSHTPLPSAPPSSFAPSVPPFHARFSASSLSAPPRFLAPHPSPLFPSSAPLASLASSSLLPCLSAPLPHAPPSSSPSASSLLSHLYPGGGSGFVQVWVSLLLPPPLPLRSLLFLRLCLHMRLHMRVFP